MKKTNDGKTIPMPGFDTEEISAIGQRSFAAMTHMNAHLFQALVRYNGALLDFARHRLERELEMSGKLAGCKSPDEAASLIQDFYKTAFAEYSDEVGTLMELGAKVTSSTMDGIGRETAAVINGKTEPQAPAMN
ncbi:phasin family protein [Aurantimonas marianensis]|uniref:Phasin family protein n=1 Tax=Aurantimonas marianensis TaxID=2920428 RepID=A0A9X2HFI0_9HYPH|nr:phasin family protein [Aurantimonas marianensis]MCP3056644.1 phasin family protein [Aurantimonas marianensis]